VRATTDTDPRDSALLDTVELFRRFAGLKGQLPWVVLGNWPTRVQRLEQLEGELGHGPLFVKREDESSPIFGGNKIRTLEGHFGRALAEGAHEIWSTGAYGTNHGLAAVMHAPRVGLGSGSILFPQPATETACGNLRASLATGAPILRLRTPVTLPLGVVRTRLGSARRRYIMAPGGATPTGSLGHVSAALELARQVEDGELPAPRIIVIAVGSTCTSAGLTVGLCLAERLGIGFGAGKAPRPLLHAVRVTPWPITSSTAIAWLAERTSRALAALVGDVARFSRRELRQAFRVDGRFFAGGYGRPLEQGPPAREQFLASDGPPLDEVYSQKSGAAFVALARAHAPAPLLFWATRTSAILPQPSPRQLDEAPRALKRWLERPRLRA